MTTIYIDSWYLAPARRSFLDRMPTDELRRVVWGTAVLACALFWSALGYAAASWF